MYADIVIELTRLRLALDTREDVVRIACPFHSDDTPSLDVFRSSSNFHCHGCKKSGDFATLLAKLENKPRYSVEAELKARYGDDDKPVEPDQVERFHREIWGADNLLASLRHRMISDDIIRKFRLGRDGDRITIPIHGPGGFYVNVRKYLPDRAPDDRRPKITNMKGRGSRLRIYPFNQLKYQEIVLWGGEIKALAALTALNAAGIGSVCMTGGEGDWSTSLETFFSGKRVWVCNDVDMPGVKATAMRCSRLAVIAERVDPLHLPLDTSVYPSGDVNDYLRDHGEEALLKLLSETEPYQTPAAEALSELLEDSKVEPKNVSLNSLNDPSIVNQRISCEVAVSALDQNIYYVPRRVKVKCTRDQPLCAICPVFAGTTDEFEIAAESIAVLAMVESNKKTLNEELREGLKIPPCKVADFKTLTNFKVIDIRVQRSLDLTENSSDHVLVPAVVVDDEVELNETYRIVGRALPHPRSQAATLILSQATAIEDALSAYDPGDTSDLLIFRPLEWTVEAVAERMRTAAEYLSLNVTGIYDRPRLHEMIDLTFHSVLSFKDDHRVIKGVMELLVIGDPGQGKSFVAKYISEYYGLGRKVDCKNATVAGLLGGLEQINGKWFAQWGAIPTHDRRLVILEELKGMREEVFAKLTDMRSEQVAEIPKIKQSRARARTRLIALSNVKRHNTFLGSYAFGVRAISELIPNPEDVRRFDACLLLSKDDIDSDIPNSVRPRLLDAPFSQDAARRLVLWAWTRESDQVVISPETYEHVLAETRRLCRKYTDSVPLLDGGSTRYKLLRMAVACAARTFSSDATGVPVIVLPCHVDWVVQTLEAEYSSRTHGYLALSEALAAKQGALDIPKVLNALGQVSQPELLIRRLLRSHDIDMQDFCDWNSWSRDEAAQFVAILVRANALERDNKTRSYIKVPEFVRLLQSIDEGTTTLPTVPAHIAKDEEY